MNSNFHKRRTRNQNGFLVLELSLVMLITAIVGLITWTATQRASDADLAKLQADAIVALRSASHRLVMDNYSAYQKSLPITRNGVTLAAGDGAGQSRYPTVANLRGMNLSVDSAQDTGLYKSLVNAGYEIKIERTPECTANPASPDCHVTGLVCMNRPVQDYSAVAGEIDSFALGVMAARLGGSGGMSLAGSPNTIRGADGTWSHSNSYAVPGTICARFGWGTEGDDYLRLQDTRDPNFKGGQTVSGTIAGSTYTQQVNGDANVTGRLTLGGTGALGTACTPEGSMVWGLVGDEPSLLKCAGGIWVASGTTVAADGAVCAPEGKSAKTATGAGLVCRNNFYRPLADMVGRGGLYEVALYSQGQVVPTPLCSGANMVPRLVILGVSSACVVGGGACSNTTGSFVGSLSAANAVTIVGSNGASAGTSAMMAVASMCTTW